MGWKVSTLGKVESLLAACAHNTPYPPSACPPDTDQDAAPDDPNNNPSALPLPVNTCPSPPETCYTFVTTRERDSAVGDMLALCKIFRIPVHTFARGVNLLDRFLSVMKVRPKFLNCIWLSCIFLAATRPAPGAGTCDRRKPRARARAGKSSDMARFISASQSNCTYSDVQRMADVISKKLGLDSAPNSVVTLYEVFTSLRSCYTINSFPTLLDFYARCLCSQNLATQPPQDLAFSILGLFMKPQHFTSLCGDLSWDLSSMESLTQQLVLDAFRSYNGSEKKGNNLTPRLQELWRKYVFRVSQRTGQLLQCSQNKMLALAQGGPGQLAPIQEEAPAMTSSSDVMSDESSGGELEEGPYGRVWRGRGKRGGKKGLRYTKMPCWFGFSNHATARATKPYYKHLVSSWSPWSQPMIDSGAAEEGPATSAEPLDGLPERLIRQNKFLSVLLLH